LPDEFSSKGFLILFARADLASRSEFDKGHSMTQKRLAGSEQEVLSPDDVAQMLRVSRRKINQLVAAGEVPFVRVGRRRIRFRRQAVREWFRKQNFNNERR
jgi:excisionase family DNA binding protein